MLRFDDENPKIAHHLTSNLIQTNHRRILKNPQNGFFKSVLSLVQRWHLDENSEAEVQAVVEQQYFLSVPVPVQHMAIFNHSVAEPDRNI